MFAIASPQQPTSSFLTAERSSFHTGVTAQVESDDNDEESCDYSTVLAFGMTSSSSSPSSLPKRQIIRRRSSRNKQQQRTIQKNAGATVKRTVSQKRKRAEVHHVSFRDDKLVECIMIEKHGHDVDDNDDDNNCAWKKNNEFWYDPSELRQKTFDELSRNWQLHVSKGPGYPLEESNLTWRGLEDYAPSPTDSAYSYHQDGVEKRVEKISHHVSIVLAIARSIEDRSTTVEEFQPNEDVQDDDEGDDDYDWENELAEKSYLLSKSDRDDAIERAQKDAYEALREHGVEYGPGYNYANHDYYYDYYDKESALKAATGSNKDIALVPSVIETLVAWFCL